MLNQYLNELTQGKHLSREEAARLAEALMAPGNAPALIGALLAALRTKGETAEEIAGFVSGLKRHATPVPAAVSECYDVAGTGGDGAHTRNISTLTAFILAGTGIPIAKHGNRSVSSRCGSADVLHEAGVNIHATASTIGKQLEHCGICFIYAPLAHPAMKHVMEVRRTLQVPSLFNLAGPLSNPMALSGQTVGVYSPQLIRRMGEALVMLGVQRGAVLHGHGGLDEASLSGDNEVLFIEGDRLTPARISGAALDLTPAPVKALRGGSPADNARALTAALSGCPGAYRDAGLLNSAIALYGFGKAETLSDALITARHSLDSGSALNRLEQLKAHSQEGRPQ